MKGREPDNAYAVACPNFEQRLVRGETPRRPVGAPVAGEEMVASRQRL